MKPRMLALAMLAAMSAAPVLAASGEQAGPPIVVDGVYGATVLDTHVSATLDGFSVMVWTVENTFTGQRELKMQRFASWGDLIGAPITVAGPSLGLSHPRVAIAPNRNALVVWQEDAVDGDGSAILARAYDGASGLPRDNAFVVNQTTLGAQQLPSIAMDRHGNHAVILWDTPAAEGGHAAMARAYTSWGTPLCASCNEFRLNTDASPNPTQPSAYVNTWGEIYAFWLGRESSSSLFDRILGRKFFWDGSAFPTGQEVWGASLFNPADISEFSVAENEMELPSLAFALAGNVYSANAPGAAVQVLSSGSACGAPQLSNHVFAGQGLAMNCDLGPQRLPYVALSSFGPFAPNVIADNVLPPYAPGTIAVSGFATDTDGNGILTASLPAGVYGYDSSAAVFRIRGLAATAMAVTVAGDTPASSGTELAYTVTVSNQGPTSAIPNHHELKGLALALALPTGTSLINAGGGGWTCVNAVPVQCKFADVLPPQQQSELTIRTTGLSAPATATLQASLTSIVNSTPTVATGSASIEIANPDTSPDPFTLPSYQSVPRMTYYLEQVSISGIDRPTPISIKNGRYAINNGRFTSVEGLVSNGDTVQVEHYAAGTFSTTQSTHLTVGDVTASLTTTTEAEDTSVTPFDLVDVSNVPRNSLQTSNAIEVQGINTAVAISVIGGSYSINDGGFGNLPGIVQPGDSVVVRHVAAPSFATATNTTLSIGDQSAVFTSITESMDTTPDAFAFIDQSNLATNVEATSAPITVTGINAGAVINISGGSYSVNGGAFVTAAGTVQANDVVRARVRTAITANAVASASITIGGVTDTFSATTGASDTTPDGFNFTDQTAVRRNRLIVSDAVTIGGINTAVPISLSGDSTAVYSKNGGGYTAKPGTVVKGDQIRLQIQSSAAANTTSSVTVTIGGVNDLWSVTTGNR